MSTIGIWVICLALALGIFGYFAVRYMDKVLKRKTKQSRQQVLTEMLKSILEGKWL